MRAMLTILTVAAFSAHVLLGCGCQQLHAHDGASDQEPELHVCGGDHDGGHHHHGQAPNATPDVTQDGGDSHQPCERCRCQCGHAGCVYVVVPKVKSSIEQGALFARVEIAPTSAANLPGPDVGRAAFEMPSGPPRSLRSHLLLQILLV